MPDAHPQMENQTLLKAIRIDLVRSSEQRGAGDCSGVGNVIEELCNGKKKGDSYNCRAVDQGAGRGVIAVNRVWVGIKRLPK